MADDASDKTGRIQKIKETLNEQPWFQEAKGKWDELDSQSQEYIQYGLAGGASLILMIFLLSSWWTVRSLKNDLRSKEILLQTIQQATAVKRGYAASGMRPPTEGPAPWDQLFQSAAQQAGIGEGGLQISPLGNGLSDDNASEKLFQLQASNINMRQAIGLAVNLENNTYPIKIRKIDFKTDGSEGALSVQYAVSGFEIMTEGSR